MKIGSRGKEVKWLQKILGERQDGIFGEKTEEALKVFQILHDLTVDGVVDEITRERLKHYE